MIVRENVPLAPCTTLQVGGPARVFVEAESEEDVRAAREEALRRGLPLVVLGGGSNVLIPDEGIDAVVARVRISGIVERMEEDLLLEVGAGVSWDDVVKRACELGVWGIENLAAIPGTVGGAVVQNIGAYGTELSETFVYADVLDIATGEQLRIRRDDAEFSYRMSVWKKRRSLIVLRAALRLSKWGSPKLSYPDLARAKEQGVPLATPAEIATAVRVIRSAKFPTDPQEGTAGSFFKHPFIEASALARLLARYPQLPHTLQPDGRAKVSLTWLLDHALHLKGYAQGFVQLSPKQPIVLIATKGARASDIDEFANNVAARVKKELEVEIEREVETLRT